MSDSAPLKPEAPDSRHGRRRSRTREALLKAASTLFQEKGVGSATVAEIALRADVGYGSLYNHFKGLEEIIEVLAVESMHRMLEDTRSIMAEVTDARLLPCIAARVILRTFVCDPVVRWMLERPYVFTATFERVARPSMLQFETPFVTAGVLQPAAGHDAWIRTLPWILLSELHGAIDDARGDALAHEESFARICMRLLGVPDRDAEGLLASSLALVEQRGL